jgi:hypothetical protein
MICDAGGGTIVRPLVSVYYPLLSRVLTDGFLYKDLAVYKIIGQMANLEIAEMCARSGANCGSIFLDLRFRELVKNLLQDHPAHLNPASLAYFMHSFSETDKLAYTGVADDGEPHSTFGPIACSRIGLSRQNVPLHLLQCRRPT